MRNNGTSTSRHVGAASSTSTRPSSRTRRDRGDTLLEILLTVMLIGVTVTALMSSLANAGNAGNIQRISVQTDVVMRNYAEATKSAVQGCIPGHTYTVVYEPPKNFIVATFTAEGLALSPAGSTCPAIGTTKVLTLVITAPLGAHQTMHIRIRTP